MVPEGWGLPPLEPGLRTSVFMNGAWQGQGEAQGKTGEDEREGGQGPWGVTGT